MMECEPSMPEPTPPLGETLERHVSRLLRTIPETWAEFDPTTQSELEARAHLLLTAAAMIERRLTFRLRMFGHPVALEATITLTGEAGLAEAIRYVTADIWEDWREVFESRKRGELKDAPTFHCERIGPEQHRLTSEGVVARQDLGTSQESVVFDFVLKRGFFDGRPRLLGDGRISHRLPIAGKGTLERMRRVRLDASPADVSIANWGAGAEAFRLAFAELLKARGPEALPGSGGKGTKRKRGTAKGDGRVKLIATLTKHHRYADGSCLNAEPIGNNELARAAGVSNSTASAFLTREFRGRDKYMALCRDPGRLAMALKLLNGEVSPGTLFGRCPPREGERDDD